MHTLLWAAGLLDLFKGLIENAITGAVQSTFTSAIGNFITNKVNPELAAIPMDLPLKFRAPYNIAEVRFGLTANPVITDSYIGVGLQGDVVPIANPVPPPITPPALPPFNPASANNYLQMQLSSYTFDSAAYTFYQAGVAQWTIPSSSLPPGFNNTAVYGLIAPELPLEYPGSAVSVNLTATSQPSLTISPGGLNVSANAAAGFLVSANNGSTVTAFTLGVSAQLAAEITVGPDSNGSTAILGSISYLGCNLTVLSSNVGTVNAGLLQT